ncbi:MAG: FecR family protein [Cyclobacteriaceae bacterium]|nr:FecR family protein [Cyclobacteriaceae bacterium]
MDRKFYIAELIAKENKGSISSEEKTKMEQWVNESRENERVYRQATNNDSLLDKAAIYDLFSEERAWKVVGNRIGETSIIPIFRRRFLRYAAVLIPLLVAFSLTWFYFDKNEPKGLSLLDQTTKPGTDKAVLILEDGSEIDLSQTGNKKSVIQGKTTALLGGKKGISYFTEDDTSPTPLIYNELKTPKGGKYNLTLTDGTKIWLNAGSSLRFPVAFTDTTRNVFLTGEAYFEVSHGEKPFIVSTNTGNIRVLGTVFNVSAYADDSEIKTTLAEGSVKITPDSASDRYKILFPGNQAIVKKQDKSINIEQVNVAFYTSWVENKLEFNNENLENVMKRLARWYNFTYEFENEQARNYHFTARFDNNQQASSILEMLEMTTEVKFEIINQNVIIK